MAGYGNGDERAKAPLAAAAARIAPAVQSELEFRPDKSWAKSQSETSGPGSITVGLRAQEKPSAESTQNADATASSKQQEPSNEKVSLRTDEPGSDGSVTQKNISVAEASATNDGQSGAIRQCVGNVQDARATATSTQEGPSNTNASVRVNSPGDNGDVTQVNSSQATATASNGCAATQRGAGKGQEAQARATATQDGASNTNASVRVFSDGDDGGLTQANMSEATARASDRGGSLRASQTALAKRADLQNINVSIRVQSDGGDGPVNQRNESKATPSGAVETKGGAGALEVSVERNGQNVNVAIALNSDSLPPLKAGEFWLWRWVWPWEGDPDQTPDWDAIAESIDGWTWDFSNPSAATPVGRPVVEKVSSASGIDIGTWTWKWEFTNEGRPIDWSWKETLDGCRCAWIWSWNWAWVQAKNGGPAQQQQTTDAQASGEPGATESAKQNAGPASRSITQSNSSSSVARATNESIVEQSQGEDGAAGQSTHVDQSAVSSAESTRAGGHNSAPGLSGRVNQARSSSAEASAANTSSVNRSAAREESASGPDEQSAQVVQSASATAVAPSSPARGKRSAIARASNVSEIAQSNRIGARDNEDDGSGTTSDGDSTVVICTTTEIRATCSRRNEASVKQTAEAHGGDALARNVSKVEQSNQIAGRDNRSSVGGDGAPSSSADVCNADGPTTNCAQVNTAAIVQEAVAAGYGASAQNEAEVVASNQIAGRDASAGAARVMKGSGVTSAGVCNAGGEAVNCRQKNSIQLEERASARGGTSVARKADVRAVNQLAGRDTAAGAAWVGNQSGDSFAGVCNAGGPTINCAQENDIQIMQPAPADGRRESAEKADVLAVNQIAGRDTYEGVARGSDQSGVSAAGVCNSGGPTRNCAQVNTVRITQEARRGGRAWAENEAVNQIAGRDTYEGVPRVTSQSRNSSAGVCNTGGKTTNCTQENRVQIAQEAPSDRSRRSAGNEAETAAVNEIAGRDTAGDAPRVSNRSRDSFAGVCNAGGEATNCTQENRVQIAQEAPSDRSRLSVENEADGLAVNAIAGRDTTADVPRVSNRSRDSFAGVCNAGGPATNCTQENSFQIPQEASAWLGRGSAENEAGVAAVNQLAGRDTYKGAARATNRSRDSSAGVCNTGGETTNCTQLNTAGIVREAVAGSRRGRASVENEADVVAVTQLTGRDAYAGSAMARNRTLDSSADVCNSDGEAAGCTQENSAFVDRAGKVRRIKQIAGRDRHRGSDPTGNRDRATSARVSNSNGGPKPW